MISPQEFLDLQKQLEKLQKEESKCELLQEQLAKSLLEEFSCKSVKEAKALLKKLEQQAEQQEQEYTEALREFREHWPNLGE